MLTHEQSTIVYLMFLNGCLFLGLNFIAYSLVFPGPRGSKRIGYVLIVAALLAFFVEQEVRALLSLGFPAGKVWQVVFAGFAVPVFLVSAVYYRIRRNRQNRAQKPTRPQDSETHETHRSEK